MPMLLANIITARRGSVSGPVEGKRTLKGGVYGRRLVRFGLYIWIACHSLLEVRADFGANDSTALQNIKNNLSNFRDEFNAYAPLVQSDVSQIHYLLGRMDSNLALSKDELIEIYYELFWGLNSISNNQLYANRKLDSIEAIGRSGFNNVTNIQKDTLTEVRTIRDSLTDSSPLYHKLQDIEASIDGVSINITNALLVSISNAIAQTPRCNCVLTNFLTTSGNFDVDMRIVTNATLLANFFTDILNYYPFMEEDVLATLRPFLSWYGLVGPSDYSFLHASGLQGFLMAAMVSALAPTAFPYTPPSDVGNMWQNAWDYWSGSDLSGALGLAYPYTIFEAYNTLNETNLPSIRIAVESLTNMHVNASAVAKAIGPAYEVGDDVPLNYTNDASLPEWEPSYKAGVDDNTNHYFYVEQVNDMTSKLFKTNTFGVLSGEFDDVAEETFNGKLSFSGIEMDDGLIGGWDVDYELPELDEDTKRTAVALWHLFFNCANVFVFVVFARRIHKVVTDPEAVS